MHISNHSLDREECREVILCHDLIVFMVAKNGKELDGSFENVQLSTEHFRVIITDSDQTRWCKHLLQKGHRAGKYKARSKE